MSWRRRLWDATPITRGRRRSREPRQPRHLFESVRLPPAKEAARMAEISAASRDRGGPSPPAGPSLRKATEATTRVERHFASRAIEHSNPCPLRSRCAARLCHISLGTSTVRSSAGAGMGHLTQLRPRQHGPNLPCRAPRSGDVWLERYGERLERLLIRANERRLPRSGTRDVRRLVRSPPLPWGERPRRLGEWLP